MSSNTKSINDRSKFIWFNPASQQYETCNQSKFNHFQEMRKEKPNIVALYSSDILTDHLASKIVDSLNLARECSK